VTRPYLCQRAPNAATSIHQNARIACNWDRDDFFDFGQLIADHSLATRYDSFDDNASPVAVYCQDLEAAQIAAGHALEQLSEAANGNGDARRIAVHMLSIQDEFDFFRPDDGIFTEAELDARPEGTLSTPQGGNVLHILDRFLDGDARFDDVRDLQDNVDNAFELAPIVFETCPDLPVEAHNVDISNLVEIYEALEAQ